MRPQIFYTLILLSVTALLQSDTHGQNRVRFPSTAQLPPTTNPALPAGPAPNATTPWVPVNPAAGGVGTPPATLNGVVPFDPYARPAPTIGLPPASTVPSLPSTALPTTPFPTAPLPTNPYPTTTLPPVPVPQYTPPSVATPPPPLVAAPAQPAPFSPPDLYEPVTANFAIGFEAPVLRAYPGAFTYQNTFFQGIGPPLENNGFVNFDPDFNLEFSPRIWAGIRGSYGLIFRGRYWRYDTDTNAGNLAIGQAAPPTPIVDPATLMPAIPAVAPTRFGVEIDAIDLEIAQQRDISCWVIELGGAIRYSELDLNQRLRFNYIPAPPLLSPVRTFDAQSLSTFKGVGPGLFISGRREIGWRGFTFLSKARLTFLFGDTNWRSNFSDAINPPDPPFALVPFQLRNQVVQVWELQAGIEWSRELNSGARLFAGAMVEGQVWELPATPLAFFTGDLGLFGPTFHIGVDW